MTTISEKPGNVFGPTLSRRQFVKAGGALVVGFGLVGPEFLKGGTAKAATTFKNSLDPGLSSSWIEIHPDNTILIRTGKNDFGQGTTFTVTLPCQVPDASLAAVGDAGTAMNGR